MHNFFQIPEYIQTGDREEFFELLLSGKNGLRIERIISHGHATAEGVWYDQDLDEWVMVLEGEASLAYADGSLLNLDKGDHVLIPAHCKHRVVHTSAPCIWLALHGQNLMKSIRPPE